MFRKLWQWILSLFGIVPEQDEEFDGCDDDPEFRLNKDFQRHPNTYRRAFLKHQRGGAIPHLLGIILLVLVLCVALSGCGAVVVRPMAHNVTIENPGFPQVVHSHRR